MTMLERGMKRLMPEAFGCKLASRKIAMKTDFGECSGKILAKRFFSPRRSHRRNASCTLFMKGWWNERISPKMLFIDRQRDVGCESLIVESHERKKNRISFCLSPFAVFGTWDELKYCVCTRKLSSHCNEVKVTSCEAISHLVVQIESDSDVFLLRLVFSDESKKCPRDKPVLCCWCMPCFEKAKKPTRTLTTTPCAVSCLTYDK